MKTLFLAAGLVMGSAGLAAACPTWELGGLATIDVDGATLYQVLSAETAAGGDNEMAACNLSNIGSGYVATQPDFEFQLSGMSDYSRLEFRVEAACDTVLLMNDASATIRFNDDTNGSDPAISIDNPSDGTYHIWIGTYGPDACAATLYVETF